jgi:aconitate hydratase 2/2-methylisocitrate dehydratase
LSSEKATELLGTMLGGYNLTPLIDLLDNKACAPVAAAGLKKTLLMFDQFHDVKEKADKGNAFAKEVVQSWADAEWLSGFHSAAAALAVAQTVVKTMTQARASRRRVVCM